MRVGNEGELIELRSVEGEFSVLRSVDDERFNCEMILDSEGLRRCARNNGDFSNCGEAGCSMVGDAYCAGETKRDVTLCAAANVRRGDTGSEFGVGPCAGGDRDGGNVGRAKAHRGQGRSEGHKCEVRGLPCASSKKGGNEKGWKKVEAGDEVSGWICATGEIECMIRRFAKRFSEGEHGGEFPGEPEGEQKGESKNSEGGEGAGGMGDPGATEVGGDCGITGERGCRVPGDAGERVRSVLVNWSPCVMCEKLIGERRELGRMARAVGEQEVGV